MKKYIIFLALALLLLTATTAFAQTEKERDICKLVEQHENIKEAVCLVEQRLCVVAIRANKFVNKSQYMQFVHQTTEQIQQQFDIDKVVITRNPRLFSQLKKIASLSENDRQELVQQLLDELASKPEPIPYLPELHGIFSK